MSGQGFVEDADHPAGVRVRKLLVVAELGGALQLDPDLHTALEVAPQRFEHISQRQAPGAKDDLIERGQGVRHVGQAHSLDPAGVVNRASFREIPARLQAPVHQHG